jgi:hypothetical protein
MVLQSFCSSAVGVARRRALCPTSAERDFRYFRAVGQVVLLMVEGQVANQKLAISAECLDFAGLVIFVDFI